MSSKKLNKSYVSEIDKFLGILDSKFTKTQSQNAEISKARRIDYLRSHIKQTEFHGNQDIWEGF